MDFALPGESPREKISKLTVELHRERIDRYEIERTLAKIDSLKEEVINKTFTLLPNDMGTLIPLIHTIQDDLYRLHGTTWRSVYLSNKREKNEGEIHRLNKELYEVEKESKNLLTHVDEAENLIKKLKPKNEAMALGAAFILIAMSGFMFSSFQSYKMFVFPHTGFSILPSLGLMVYFVFVAVIVVMMFVFLFGLNKRR